MSKIRKLLQQHIRRLHGLAFAFMLPVFGMPCQGKDTDRVLINQKHIPGKNVIPSEKIPYHPEKGERYLVNAQHKIPAGMIVQGDSVELEIRPETIKQFDPEKIKVTWSLLKKCGQPQLRAKQNAPLKAIFLADAYGVNTVSVTVSDGSKTVRGQSDIYVEFSMGVMLSAKNELLLPAKKIEASMFSPDPEKYKAASYRQQNIAFNPNTGALVSLSQVLFYNPNKSGSMYAKLAYPYDKSLPRYLTKQASQVRSTVFQRSSDGGITWSEKPQILHFEGKRTGWHSVCWNPHGNAGKGEFIAWVCTHVQYDGNRLLFYRSRDDGKSWQFVKDHTEAITSQFGAGRLSTAHFPVKSMFVTSKNTIVAPMCFWRKNKQWQVRVVWSDDNGETWHNSNIDDSFLPGTENAIVETGDGNKLVLLARVRESEDKPTKGIEWPYGRCRYESTDGGKTWTDKGEANVPATCVNLGLARINSPGTGWDKNIVYASPVYRRSSAHDRHKLVVSLNNDIQHASDKSWEHRLLIDYCASYPDVLYLPQDKALLVTYEGWGFGKPMATKYSKWGDQPDITYLKFSEGYWKTLPKYSRPTK